MAKLKNRDKRKKAQAKKANQEKARLQEQEKIFPLVFEGYMMIPLDTSLDPEIIRERTTYVGQWVIERHRIMSRERRYRVTAHLFRHGVIGKAIATTYLDEKVDEASVLPSTQKAFNEAREDFNDIDMSQVYICVRA